MSRIHLHLLLVLALAATTGPAVHAAAQQPEEQLQDLTIRYVNADVLTLWDVRDRIRMRLEEFQATGKPVPTGRAEITDFAMKILEDLTDDQLLVQRAKELGIQVNHEQVIQEVHDRAKLDGTSLTMRDQAFRRRLVERQRYIDYLLGSLDGLLSLPTPTQLTNRYTANSAGYDRPTRVRVVQVILQVASREQRANLRKSQEALLLRAQDATDPAVKAEVDRALQDYGSAKAADQAAILDRLVHGLARFAGKAQDLPPADRDVILQARNLAQSGDTLLDHDKIQDRLDTIRLRLTGHLGDGLVLALQDVKRQFDLPVEADDDGMWMEPGTSKLDDVIFALQPGEVSKVVWVGDSARLVAVVEREEARRRTFDEVSGELDRVMRREKTRALRREVVASLRSRASIHDVVPFAELLRQIGR